MPTQRLRTIQVIRSARLIGALLALSACYPETDASSQPEDPTPVEPGPPPRVGVLLFGNIISASNRALLYTGANVDVYDPSCTNGVPGVEGIGYAPSYKEDGMTYQAHLVTQRSAFDACVRVGVGYAYVDTPGGHVGYYNAPVSFTPLGATLGAQGQRFNIVVP